MAKRFLCYDTDNPVGVTPEGVLDPNAMGGADLIFVSEKRIDEATKDNTNVICNDLVALKNKIAKRQPVVVSFCTAYLYGKTMCYETEYATTITTDDSDDFDFSIDFIKLRGSTILTCTIRVKDDGQISTIDRYTANLSLAQ